jgi:uncharacterized protein YycO
MDLRIHLNLRQDGSTSPGQEIMALFEKTIPLTPAKGGGLCIGPDSLQTADILVSTTLSPTSGAIRIFTRSPVSHASLYVGDGNVIEAIGTGVTRRALTEALRDDVLAVAYRSPAVTPVVGQNIVKYALAQVGRGYSRIGAASSVNPVLCRISSNPTASFFCSQLVLESYKQAGVPLTSQPSQCMSPEDVAMIAQSQLIYVGHLLGDITRFPVILP